MRQGGLLYKATDSHGLLRKPRNDGWNGIAFRLQSVIARLSGGLFLGFLWRLKEIEFFLLAVEPKHTAVTHNDPEQIFPVIGSDIQDLLIPFIDQIEQNILKVVQLQFLSLLCSNKKVRGKSHAPKNASLLNRCDASSLTPQGMQSKGCIFTKGKTCTPRGVHNMNLRRRNIIAQLSRKNNRIWKTIPVFLHGGVGAAIASDGLRYRR